MIETSEQHLEFMEKKIVGSRNHSYVQACLIIALSKLGKFILFTELSLEINAKEYKPDVCAYPLEYNLSSLARDVLKVQEMPLLAIEVLSPRQSIETIMEKFDLYFQAGVKSCWLVIPSAHTVSVYRSLDDVESFSNAEIVDQTLQINLSLKTVFGQTN